ncbi:hypothetical protein B296_00034773 [Ensete ventricosum]|uniref:Uncharacterized protein n=1 Tax=Ensete ventricosum TaxID=4639 RepID=A0A427A4H9_ENSVE|nr:hypothetical protein B296_00034773 [Ensete ventricosum]
MDCPRKILRPGVTREWVDEGELRKERTESEVAEALRCAGRGHTLRDRGPSMIGVTGELDCCSANIRLREPDKSEDKAEGVEVGNPKGEEATTSPEGLSYPKAKRRLERRWTRRSVTVPRGGSTDCEERDANARQRIVGPCAGAGTAEAGPPWSHRSLALMEGEHWS